MNQKIVLLVEDNPDDAELTLRAFKKNHILNEIVMVEDGAEALDYLFGSGAYSGSRAPGLPQCVLLDLNLPKLSGLDVLRRIRAEERTCCLPVIILTTSQEEQDLIESYQLGANGHLRKPVDFERFSAAVKQLGLSWFVLNEALPAEK